MTNSNNNILISETTCQAFASLFKGRTDAWFHLIEKKKDGLVTLDHYKRHLNGQVSLGVYFLRQDNTCYFATIDLDRKDFNQARTIRDTLNARGLYSYISESKGKGYHIDLFFQEPTPAKDIGRILLNIMDSLHIDVEIFPKQDALSKTVPYGNAANLPCFGYTRPFIAVTKKEGHPHSIKLEDALARIKRIHKETIYGILEKLPEPPPLKEHKPRSKRRFRLIPPCIQEMLKGVEDGRRDEAAFTLARYFLDRACLPEEVLSILKGWDENNKPPKADGRWVELKVRSAEKGYHFGCDSIIKNSLLKEFCVGKEGCEWWKAVRNRDELQEIESIEIDGVTYYQRDDKKDKRDNGIFKSHKEEGLPFPIITTLANLTIEPRLRIILPDEDERLETLVKTDKGNYPVIFKKAAFNSKRQLLAALPQVDLQYYGSDKDTQAILALLTREELPKRKGTTVLGRNGDLWVLKDKVISSNGVMNDPNIMYIPSGIDLERRVRYSSHHNDNSNEIIKQLVALNEQAAILPILGWFFSTPFTPLIREKQGHFPLLSAWGTHGAGKSSLLELLSETLGLTPQLHSSIGTKFSLLRLFSATNSIPIVLDELKPYSMESRDVKRLTNLLRRAYGGEIEDRGRADLSTVGYHIQAPIAVAGEIALTSIDSAFIERCIQTNLNPDKLTGDSSYVKAFRSLKAMDKRGFAFNYIRWCLDANLESLMTKAETSLPEDLKQSNERIRDNILVMITGLIALKDFSGDESLIDKEGIAKAITNERAELLGEKGYPDVALTTFLETLATLAQTNRIRPCIHYMTGEAETRLYIHLEDCLTEFRKFVRETDARIEVLDKKAYRQQAKEMLGKGYVIQEEKQKWFPSLGENVEGKNRKCLEIDMEKLKQSFDTSGFLMPSKIDMEV